MLYLGVTELKLRVPVSLADSFLRSSRDLSDREMEISRIARMVQGRQNFTFNMCNWIEAEKGRSRYNAIDPVEGIHKVDDMTVLLPGLR